MESSTTFQNSRPSSMSSSTLRRNESLMSSTSTSTSRSSSVRDYVRQMSNVPGVTSKLKRLANYKERFATYLKLSVAMGLTWTLEVVAYHLSSNDTQLPRPLLLAMNFLNVFQGVIIFFVFAVKRNTKEKLRIAFIKSGFSFGYEAAAGLDEYSVTRIRRVTSRGHTDSLPAEFRRQNKKAAKLRLAAKSNETSSISATSSMSRNDVTSDPTGMSRKSRDLPSPT